MKKLTMISAMMIVLAMIMAGCRPESNPTPGPVGPQPENIFPQGPQPGGDLPQAPQPGGDVPPGPQPGGDVPPGPLPGGDVPPGPMPGGDEPPNPQPTPTVKSGGGSAPTATLKARDAVVARLDLGLVNIFGNSNTGNIMATIKNEGNLDVNATVTLQCTGDWRTCDVCKYASSTVSVSISLKPSDIKNIDTGLDLNSAISHQAVTCVLTPPSGDAHAGNNAYGPVTVK